MVLYLGRSVLELSGFLKPNVDDWVKIRLERWVEEYSDNMGDLLHTNNITYDELNRMEEKIRRDVLESHRPQNWTTVKVFASLAVLIVIGRGCSYSKYVEKIDLSQSQEVVEANENR
jgi:hypothetical protein